MEKQSLSTEDAYRMLFADNEGTKSAKAQRLKEDWNAYVSWLDKKGMKGNPALDKGAGYNNTGVQYLKMYIKENPKTSLTPESITEVQENFKNYRDYAINEIKNKRATYDGDISKIDTPESDFMKDLSIVDGIPGHRTTNWKFPETFLKTIYQSPTGAIEKEVVSNTGLAPLPNEKK